MSLHTVITVCQALTNEGKKPTTALVRSRLSSPLPLATVMKGIKSFNANPRVDIPAPIKANEQSEEECCQCSKKVRELQAQVNKLSQSLTTLQAQVAALSQ